ncbi:hypothetical protein GGR28_002964 [Lewinella aquimaris]|uniref:T9SS type A sorting domain-containing protein n=1 Tax=Neolewinella aquimaris TaxID=1835722 RepID=A0A840E5J0_9BACT|nr:hypothetical protein [Neolewinella aquimaris]MBB4080330.1 hypothetical protein [Neolewinella aquimaris]
MVSPNVSLRIYLILLVCVAVLLPVSLFAQISSKGRAKSVVNHSIYHGGVAGGDDFEMLSDASLPVDLVSFAAEATTTDRVTVSWETEYEADLYGFSVEYSPDGVEYQQVAWQAPAAKDGRGHYVQELPRPAGTVAYYRLRVEEADGTSWNSDLSHLRFTTDGWSVSPAVNPVVGNRATFKVAGVTAGESLAVRVVDLNGRVVHHGICPDTGRSEHLRLSLELNPATYVVTFRRDDGRHQSHKLVVR